MVDFFRDSSNCSINGDFTNVQGNMSVYGGGNSDPLTILLRASARHAMHDADFGDMPTASQVGTKRRVMKQFKAWEDEADSGKNVLWLSGPPGSGKTTIARMVLDLLEDNGRFAATFFFSRDENSRNSPRSFVPTVAYQLAMWNPNIKEKIMDAVKANPAILTAKLEKQWAKLVVEPLKAIDAKSIPRAVIIIDALCECGTVADQQLILSLIESCGAQFPLAFMITSAPEEHISAAFSRPKLSEMCRTPIKLDDIMAVQKEVVSAFTQALESARRERGSATRRGAPSPEATEIVQEAAHKYVRTRQMSVDAEAQELLSENASLESETRKLRRELETSRQEVDDLKKMIEELKTGSQAPVTPAARQGLAARSRLVRAARQVMQNRNASESEGRETESAI